MSQPTYETSIPVSLRDFTGSTFPCGDKLVTAEPLMPDTPIFPQDCLSQQRKNLTASLENNLPLEIANDFMDNHIVPVQAKNDALSLISTQAFNRQRRDLDLGNTNENSVRFGEGPDSTAGVEFDANNAENYNKSDEWLSPSP